MSQLIGTRIISAKNISKKYRLFNSHQERLKEVFHPFRKQYHNEFWALKNVTFDILKGQTVGIIGRNGSGKSTLLKIITRVLRSTAGTIEINGRISALLELGAGFKPEFTGRDNVIMNGAIMGISREEMLRRMAQIEEFADIGEFIDQPVKIYSSGMFARLAFAAAINVDPDILIIDEALAVGDARFQFKCYQKFRDFQQQGKTILFVTHDIHALANYCDQVILLNDGAVVFHGEPKTAVNVYHDLLFDRDKSTDKSDSLSEEISNDSEVNSDSQTASNLDSFFEAISELDECVLRTSYNKDEYRTGCKRAEIKDYLIVCEGDFDPVQVAADKKVDCYIKVKAHEAIQSPLVGFGIHSTNGTYIYGSNTSLQKVFVPPFEKDSVIIFHFSIYLSLAGGDYFLSLGVGEEGIAQPLDRRNHIAHLFVEQKNLIDGLVDLKGDIKDVFRKNGQFFN